MSWLSAEVQATISLSNIDVSHGTPLMRHLSTSQVDWDAVHAAANLIGAVAMTKQLAIVAHLYQPYDGQLRVTHGKSVAAIAKLPPWTAFVILVSILEKALYDLHSELVKEDQKSKNMILKDLIASQALINELHPGVMILLRALFSPSALNLRNLVWHGFLTPTELSPEYTSLIMLVLREISRDRVIAPTKPLWSLTSYDTHPNLNSALQCCSIESEIIRNQPFDDILAKTIFIPTSHKELMATAFQQLKGGNHILFLFSCLPVLEHALRIHFATANNVPQLQYAQVNAYFSTLDGFGQKHKHQVLLDPIVVETGERNQLWNTLNTYNAVEMRERGCVKGPIAILLDFFMMAKGPGIRGKLCHGEADISGLENGSGSQPSVATALIFLAILTVEFPHSDIGVARIHSDGDAFNFGIYSVFSSSFISSKGSSGFQRMDASDHPPSMIIFFVSIGILCITPFSITKDCQDIDFTIIEIDGTQVQVDFHVPPNGQENEILPSYVDKRARILPTLESTDSGTFLNALVQLEDMLARDLSMLMHHIGRTKIPVNSKFMDASFPLNPDSGTYLDTFCAYEGLPFGMRLVTIAELVNETSSYLMTT
ncbi:hypothetical protein HDU80_005838 [Chytriomyces hyalinus]|nr:hypothetical protein HDU80_005838 [Chytriomyces hyalinus]